MLDAEPDVAAAVAEDGADHHRLGRSRRRRCGDGGGGGGVSAVVLVVFGLGLVDVFLGFSRRVFDVVAKRGA